MTELKPCPFCGGEAELRRNGSISDIFTDNGRSPMYFVICKECHCQSPSYRKEHKDKCVEAWNRHFTQEK